MKVIPRNEYMKATGLFLSTISLTATLSFSSCTQGKGGAEVKTLSASTVITTDEGKRLVVKSIGTRFTGEPNDEGLYSSVTLRGESYVYSIQYNPLLLIHCSQWEDVVIRPELNDDGYVRQMTYKRTWNSTLGMGVEKGKCGFDYDDYGHVTEIKSDYNGYMANEDENEYPFYGGKTATLTWEGGNLAKVVIIGEKILERGTNNHEKVSQTCAWNYSYHRHTRNQYQQFSTPYSAVLEYDFELCEEFGFMGLLGKGPMNLPDTSERIEMNEGKLEATSYFYDYVLNDDGTIQKESYEYVSPYGYKWSRDYEYEYIELE